MSHSTAISSNEYSPRQMSVLGLFVLVVHSFQRAQVNKYTEVMWWQRVGVGK